MTAPTIIEVVEWRVLQDPAEAGSRSALVRRSDATVSEAIRWYHDEILFCEGDLVGKTAAELRALHLARDRDYLS